MTITEANATNTILKWAVNPGHTTPAAWKKTEEAGRILATSANKAINSGYTEQSFVRAFKRRQNDFVDVKGRDVVAPAATQRKPARARAQTTTEQSA
jgi:hypothetical protein